MEIVISIGHSRLDTKWKNKEITWPALVAKLKEPIRTTETVRGYHAASKDVQGQIKDVGGFVGGAVTGGRRTKDSVSSRQLLTLDADNVTGDLAGDLELLSGNAFFIYSTHSHTPEAPRLRLVMPLSREVAPDEYEFIARTMAETIGMSQFDATTFQVERLMYWPSCPADGEYLAIEQEGDWLDVDACLAGSIDWKDLSQWPRHPKEVEKVSHSAQKQADPLEKPGIVGAFCRTYSISEVIDKYLSDEYTPVDGMENRYTYLHGSGAGGFIVYEDKLGYSWNATSPVSGLLCNAFDLVRMHKFGGLDTDPAMSVSRKPSFKAMVEMIGQDAAVGAQILADRAQGAANAFNDAPVDVDLPVNEWGLTVTKNGAESTISNVEKILRYDGEVRLKMAVDAFSHRDMVMGPVPWDSVGPFPREMTPVDDAALLSWLERKYGIASDRAIKAGLLTNQHANQYNPVRDYLDTLVWDGIERLDTLLVDYLGAVNNEYVRAVTRKTLIAAVSRVMRPGIKFDTVLTLVGPQGVGKSTLVRKLGGDWFSDSLTFHMLGRGVQAEEQLQGVWLMEVAEMTGVSKAEDNAIKSFIARMIDRFRPAYGRRSESFARTNIFIGTTNDDGFLKDQTGNRRYWPVRVGESEPSVSIFSDFPVDQFWAEAVKGYEKGEKIYLDSVLLQDQAKAIQESHMEEDERYELIEQYLDTLLPKNWNEMDRYARRDYFAGNAEGLNGTIQREEVSAMEIWCECFGNRKEDIAGFKTRFIAGFLKRLGWAITGENKRNSVYGKQRVYKKMEQSKK